MLDLRPASVPLGFYAGSSPLRCERPAKRLWAVLQPIRRAEKRHRCNTATVTRHSRSRDVFIAAAAAEQPIIDLEPEEDELEEQDENQQQSSLISDREGYHCLQLNGCEFLIAMSPDGQLDLRDIYVQDVEQGVSGRPDVVGDVPDRAQLYQEIEWAQLDAGDTLKGKPRRKVVQRVYLIAIEPTQPVHMLDLEHVWYLDAQSRSLARATVQRDTEETNPGDLALRIMRNGQLVLGSVATMPPVDVVVDDYLASQEQRGSSALVDPDTPQDPLERLDEIEDDFDQPDVPEVDQEFEE